MLRVASKRDGAGCGRLAMSTSVAPAARVHSHRLCAESKVCSLAGPMLPPVDGICAPMKSSPKNRTAFRSAVMRVRRLCSVAAHFWKRSELRAGNGSPSMACEAMVRSRPRQSGNSRLRLTATLRSESGPSKTSRSLAALMVM